jgi:hypothetical protein
MIKPALEIGNGKWGARDQSLLGYTQGDTIDKFIRRQFKFERGSNLGATRTNKDGLIEKGRENLLDYSNSFDRWSNVDARLEQGDYEAIQSGHEGYDGSNDAWFLSKNSGNNSYLYYLNNIINTGTNNKVWCYSVYAKAADGDSGIILYVGNSQTGGKGYVRVNLIDGSVTGYDVTHTKGYKVEGVTGKDGDKDRWWRISFFSTANVNNKPRIQPRNAAGDGQSGGKIYVMNAQFEYGTAPSKYIRTESRKNLLKNSEHFHDWINNSTVTRNVLGYDGSLDAVKMHKNATYGRIQHRVDAGTSNSEGWVGKAKGTLTLSAYAKQDSLSGFHMRVDWSTTQGDFVTTNFDLGNAKPVGSQADWIDSRKVEEVGNGWVRCSVTFTTTRPVYEINLYPHKILDDLSSSFEDPNNDGQPPQTGSIFVQHVQLEQGSQATAYEGTSSYAGLLEDMPRIDYADTDPHLLMEPTRTNKVIHSEYLEYWSTLGQGTLEWGYEAPDGTKSAYKVTNGNTNFALYIGGMLPDDTRSIWAKTVSGTGTLDLLTYGENTDNTFSITNDWQRFELTGSPHDTGDTNIYAVDFRGAGNLNEVLLWGAQCEAGAFATSYIPTYGLSVTRSNEGIPLQASGVINMDDDFGVTGDDITIFVDLAENPSLSRDNSSGGIRLSDGDNQSGAFRLYRNNDTTDLAVVFFGTSADSFGANKNSASVSLPSSATKVAVTRVRSTGVFTIYCDGSPLDEGLTDANGQFTNSYFDTSWDKFQLTGQGSTVKYSGIKFFDEALSADDLATLTS